SMFMSGLIASEVHWVGTCIFIYAFGIKILTGSASLNAFFGIDDNFKDVVTGGFMLGRIGRGAKNKVKGFVNKANKTKDFIGDKMQGSYDKISQKAQDNFYDDLHNNKDFQGALTADREQWEKDQMKEKLQGEEHQKGLRDETMKDMYGDDYKLQMEKDKLLQKEQQANLQEQAKKDMYGDDYKVLEERQKVLQGQETDKAKEKALQSVYGEDYKVSMEKDRIHQGVEKATTHDQAMKQIYGNDYKQKQIHQKAKEKAEEYNLVNQYKEKVSYDEMASKIDVSTSGENGDYMEESNYPWWDDE
ncbi:MAG: hypothetical protein ACK5LC_07550, partial [Coprobacillaceae bacterium]